MAMQRTFEYGNRPSPGTTYENMLKLKKLFERRRLVTFDDMKAATGKKWVRGFFNALKIVRKVEPVRDGRVIIGYRFVHRKKRKPTIRANDNTKQTT